jgi:serine/threonine-protein kinase
MAVREALDVGIQVASALSAAHKAGIIHRDIKPENIMIRRDGIVKVLDFGLAKLIRPRQAVTGDTQAATKVLIKTEPGIAMGTPQYMSPEQARGLDVDARTDIWSLGCVLYEMVSGQQPFTGATTMDVLSAILDREPDLLIHHLSEAPRELQHIVNKALRKDPEERYQTVQDLLIDLKDLKHALSVSVVGNELTTTSEDIQTEPPSGPLTMAADEGRWKSAVPRLSTALLIAGVLALAGVLIYFAMRGGPKPSAPVAGARKIAVLPFRSLSPDGDDEYLGLGLSDALITRLSNIRQIVVRPTSAVRKYVGREFDPLVAGREQRVDAVLEGSVERAGDRLRVTVRLINVQDERPVWGSTFNEKLTDILTVQDQIAERLANALAVNLTGEEKRGLAKQYTDDTEAYQLYLKGRYLWNKRTADDLKKSVVYFQQAVERDPLFALAYAGLADSYSLLTDYEALPAEETYPQAKMAATKALEIDGELAEARTSLAYIQAFYEWDWTGAEMQFKSAIELNPNYATAHQWYAEYLSAMGRTEEALAEIKRAEELDPVSLIISAVEGWILYFARDYDRAIGECLKVIELDPNFAEAYEYLKRSYDQKKMYREAIAARQTRRRLLGRDTRDTAALRIAASTTSSRIYWQKRLELEIDESKDESLSAFEMAEILAQLGEKDRALEWLEKAQGQHHFMITYVKVAPNLDPLRSEPRFVDLLRRLRLPEN